MQPSIAIVTGATSGLGKEFVKLLLEKETVSRIWAIARSRDDLNALSEELGGRVRGFAADLTDREALADLGRALEAERPSIAYLINDAGFGKLCSYDDIGADVSVNMIRLNCCAIVELSLLCLPYMNRGSRIVNISSQASFQPLPYQNIYAATKAFVRSYSRALNVELKSRGIGVTAVCPGWMDTAFFERAQIGAKKAPSVFTGMVSPAPVARKALKDADKGKDLSIYGLYVKANHLIAKLLPQRWMMRLWLAQQRLSAK